MKKTVTGAMIVFMIVLLCGMTVFAQNSDQELEVSIETDKMQYSGNDIISQTIKLQNISENVLFDISIQGNILENYETEEGDSSPQKWFSEINQLEAGKSSSVTIEFQKKNAAGSGNKTSIMLWAAVGVVVLIAIFILFRKKGKGILFVFLAAAITGTMMTGTEFSAKAEESQNNMTEKKAEVSKTIMVDGKEVTVAAEITYKVMNKENISLSYDGYELKWEDQFDEDSLNRDSWNVELHDPGWVNNELQAYVDSEENIYVEDGSLILKPVESMDGNGNISYTSGRVNTQNKHDFKYGLFEARVKVPKGQGFLPAFWMMPTNENLYGQWPRCGEIDIMEVLGNDTVTSYGTVHYGNPHNESQGKHTLTNGDFSDDYHVFNLEWEPGRISWYVDGILIHTENDWYSATEGQGEITYPAPFDQPFYIILNLAVGGNWPGSPNETTDIENAAYYIDYVKVYQKDSYDENVAKPEKEVILRNPDSNGNYIINGDYSAAEELNDETDWIFLTTLGGEAEAKIENNELNITISKEGTVDYSVQLVQPNLPMKKGGAYKISFDAYAEEARSMKVGVSAPDRAYIRYFEDTTVDLTTEKQTYIYEFTMKDNDDANGRLEFNLGAAGSATGVNLSNISLIKTAQTDGTEGEKNILADGNYVYNGGFQEGADRMDYWDAAIVSDAKVSVTNKNNVRRLKITAPAETSKEKPVIILQKGLALSEGAYALSLSAEGEAGSAITVKAAGQEFTVELTEKENTYDYKFNVDGQTVEKDIALMIEQPGTFYIDNVRIVEDTLIKNGSFNAGFAGYEPYVDGSAIASYVVDSLSEDNAADFSIDDTGDQVWKIQLKQNNVELEEGQWYRFSLDAKSSIDRKLMFAIQRDGTADNDWDPYSGEEIVDLGNEYQTYELVFKMEKETDLKAVLSISMGAVDNIQIIEKHRICIDNIKLEKTDEP
mgnify:FL=1